MSRDNRSELADSSGGLTKPEELAGASVEDGAAGSAETIADNNLSPDLDDCPTASTKTASEKTGPSKKKRRGRRRRFFSPDVPRRMPLTARLTLLLVTLLAFGLGISGATVLGILQSHLVAQVDEQLTRTVKRVAESSDWSSAVSTTGAQPSNYYIRIHTADGVQEFAWEPTVEDEGRPSASDLTKLEQLASAHISKPVTVASQNGSTPWRAISIPLVNSSSNTVGAVTIALPLSTVHDTVRNTRIYVTTISLCIILFCGVAAYFLVRLFLSPLREIEEVAGHIADGELHERIATREGPNTEVGSLTRSLNRMLSRIEDAFNAQRRSDERIRRFVSDASHELRTPLAAIRGYGELYRIGGVPAERTDEVFRRIESEATRMGQLVEDLLKLARLDEGRKIHMEPVNLYQIASNAALDLTALNPDRPVQLLKYHTNEPIDIAAGDRLTIVADGALLTQVLTNLVGNVDRYTHSDVPTELMIGLIDNLPSDVHLDSADIPSSPAVKGAEVVTDPTGSDSTTGSDLAIGPAVSAELIDETAPAEETGKYVLLQFCDHGPGIPREELGKVFERFYRSDTSRSRETGGTGLGLSIVAAVAAVHGGLARALETPGGGLTVEIFLPYRPPRD